MSLEYPRRLTNNYMLLTDEDDARNGEEVKQVANIIHAYLDKLGYSGIQNTRDAIPGYIKSDLTRMQMCQSDFIIIVITRSSLCDKWSRVLASCMEEALTLKLEEGYNNRVIPVFLNMTEEEVKQATQPGQPLVSCYIIHEIIADPGNDIWLHKLQKIFSQTPSRKTYPTIKKRSFNVGLMFGQRHGRWANISPTTDRYLEFEFFVTVFYKGISRM